jgi:hypothetical protein
MAIITATPARPMEEIAWVARSTSGPVTEANEIGKVAQA